MRRLLALPSSRLSAANQLVIVYSPQKTIRFERHTPSPETRFTEELLEHDHGGPKATDPSQSDTVQNVIKPFGVGNVGTFVLQKTTKLSSFHLGENFCS